MAWIVSGSIRSRPTDCNNEAMGPSSMKRTPGCAAWMAAMKRCVVVWASLSAGTAVKLTMPIVPERRSTRGGISTSMVLEAQPAANNASTSGNHAPAGSTERNIPFFILLLLLNRVCYRGVRRRPPVTLRNCASASPRLSR
ncbi:hypothetical protein D3C83_18660 [compost metagenome]